MKDYERLTERDEFGNADIIGVDSEILAGALDFDGLNKLTSALNNFADLEDKIESGELDYVADRDKEIDRLTAENAELKKRLDNAVELPCKAGDTVYCIRDLGFGRYRIEEQTASGIVFDYNNRMHVITPYGLFGYENWTFNVDCFTDRVAAEACLAELKGSRE